MEDTPGAPEQGLPPLLIEAVSYAEDRHWEVVPGTWLIDGDGPARCSCGERCELPGAHPAGEDWQRRASAGPGVVRRWWTENPTASILLPTGRAFDVLDVPEVAGCLALARMERMGLQLGPVVAVPASPGQAGRRLHFLVLPGVQAKLPEMLRQLGWGSGRLDLTARGDGDWIVAPPSRIGPYSFAQWARPPSALNRWLPDAAELINPLAYACGREAPASRQAGQQRAAAVR
ncbi:bifunctional DNA primase/polymerase [Kitasatospora sp. NPDC048540]|uniref:bifunctional DNA primase/polymerase n=1 Tax=unclassified Kitasatospora TaxID=2633591 RepID=UPI000539C8B9|nr:bifunctional DNA primase/polymerase [Kitasatospora sp. MBT63]